MLEASLVVYTGRLFFHQMADTYSLPHHHPNNGVELRLATHTKYKVSFQYLLYYPSIAPMYHDMLMFAPILRKNTDKPSDNGIKGRRNIHHY